MGKIKDSFLIQDLETLSGIKAHTIRIWEKRYDLLSPERLNRNIRKYSLFDLQKLLNVSILYNNGFKISKLSKLSIEELHETAREISFSSVENSYQLNSLIVAMYSFDALSFDAVYLELTKTKSFEEIFLQVYVPLLEHIGVLWQTDAIKPAHEHFISNLIVSKIIFNTSTLKTTKKFDEDMTYVLFLPPGELHSLGLLFLNYCLKKRGKHTLFLGGGIPFSNLEVVQEKFGKVKWICSFLLDRAKEEKQVFLEGYVKFLEDSDGESIIIGRIWDEISDTQSFEKIKFYSGFNQLPFFN